MVSEKNEGLAIGKPVEAGDPALQHVHDVRVDNLPRGLEDRLCFFLCHRASHQQQQLIHGILVLRQLLQTHVHDFRRFLDEAMFVVTAQSDGQEPNSKASAMSVLLSSRCAWKFSHRSRFHLVAQLPKRLLRESHPQLHLWRTEHGLVKDPLSARLNSIDLRAIQCSGERLA